MKKLCLATMAAMSLILVGCSGDPAPPEPAAGSSAPASSAPSSTQPSAESTTSAPAVDCLDGRYLIKTFKAVGTDQSTASGKGGDLTVSFDDGAYALQSKGKDPVAITVAGDTGHLILDGKVVGTYRPADGDKVTFTIGEGTGTAKLRSPSGKQESINVDQVAQVLAPNGEASAMCNGDKLTLKTERLTLNLEK
jgi:hypothetical protein